MLKNYIIIAIRNLFRQKMYSVINILGLAVGLACSIIIFLYVVNELSYDKYNANSERIYRIVMKGKIHEQKLNAAITPALMAGAMLQEIPEVEQVARIDYWPDMYMRYEDKAFQEEHFWMGDSSVFDVLTFEMVAGNPSTALKKPNTVTLTTETARRYFGSIDEALGKMISIGSDTALFEITGIFEPLPANSHLKIDVLTSISSWGYSTDQSWLSNHYSTYVLLQSAEQKKTVEEKLNELVYRKIGPQLEEVLNVTIEEFEESGNEIGYFLQPLEDVHFQPEVTGAAEPATDKKTIAVFIIIALFIMLIASVNFMNLSTARAANRAKEVGIRKVLGAQRSQLIRQFLSESIVITLVSMFFAITFVELALPLFNRMIDLELELSILTTWYILPAFFVLVLFVGLLSGSYPAFYLSSFRPITILRGKLKSGASAKNFRRALVVFQFAISIGIMLTTFIIYQQLNYFLNKDTGFTKEQMLVIQRAGSLENQQITFREEIMKHPGVSDASCSVYLPGYYGTTSVMESEAKSSENQILFTMNWTDPHYLSTYNIEMSEGRFLKSLAADSFACVLNETAARMLDTGRVVGQFLVEHGFKDMPERRYKIVGVVKDYNYSSLHETIGPVMLRLREPASGGVVTVRLTPGKIKETMAFIEDKWKNFTNDQPFNYFFIDNKFNELYQTEARISKVLLLFTFFAIVIAALGLYGLIAFTATQRIREIGVRKALGSSSLNIIVLLSRETMLLVLIASLIAIPVAYWGTQQWLQTIPPENTIDISVLWVLLVVAVTFIIAIATIIYQALKAASVNPAKALKYE